MQDDVTAQFMRSVYYGPIKEAASKQVITSYQQSPRLPLLGEQQTQLSRTLKGSATSVGSRSNAGTAASNAMLTTTTPTPGLLRKSLKMKEARFPVTQLGSKTTTTGGRKIHFLRSGERMDRQFPCWLMSCFVTEQYGTAELPLYIIKDMNQAMEVPERPNVPKSFYADPPLTELGKHTSQLIGQMLSRFRSRPITQIFVSPALRCIETGVAVLKTLQRPHLKLCVEPGLFDYLPWYTDVGIPSLMSHEEMPEEWKQLINENWKQLITIDRLASKLEAENPKSAYQRIARVLDDILYTFKAEDESILIIGHAFTVDAGIRSLKDTVCHLQGNELEKVDSSIPYSAMVTFQEDKDRVWKMETGFHNFTSVFFKNYTNKTV